MHGLINRAIQSFVTDTYGLEQWLAVVREAELETAEFESMLIYEDQQTRKALAATAKLLNRVETDLLEDIGTYLVSHPHTEPLRRLLRFGGVTFVEFLYSLDELPDRARLAVSDLNLPHLELQQQSADRFSLICTSKHAGWGHVMIGVLRAMADDYGALVFLEHQGGRDTDAKSGGESIEISLVESAFAEGRHFDLGAGVS